MAIAKEYVLALNSLAGIGPKKILKIGNYIEDKRFTISCIADLVAILHSLKIKVEKKEVTVGMLEQAVDYAYRIIRDSEQFGIKITTYFDDDFPKILRRTINEEGNLEPPVILYYKGDLSITKMPCLAIIGTREATDFGKKAGMFLAQEFANRGFCIVSGLAAGCDTVGHKGALSVSGKTIAFLAHGLDTIYPPQNTNLAQQIIDNGGLLMSEYPIGIEANKYRLVARDRLQAGISLATLVVQTGGHGGTMHAANATLKAQKPLYAVRFQHSEQNEHEKSRGNSMLVGKGGKYISGSDNLDDVANEILKYHKQELFD